jgi:hypothetical protein
MFMRKVVRFHAIVDVNMEDILEYAEDNELNLMDAIAEVNNTVYLGLSCVDGMASRLHGISNVDSYLTEWEMME